MNRRNFLALNGAGVMLPLIGCQSMNHNKTNESNRMNELLDQFVVELLHEAPQRATEFGLDDGRHSHLRAKLNDRSASAALKSGQMSNARLQRLRELDRSALNPEEKGTFDATLFAHELAVEGATFRFGDNTLWAAMDQEATPYVVNQMIGQLVDVPQFLDSKHPLKDQTDTEAFVERIEHFARNLDAETQRVMTDHAIDVRPPKFIVNTMLKQTQRFMIDPIDTAPLMVKLRDALAAQPYQEATLKRARGVLQDIVRPAVQRQHAAIEKIAATANDAAGVCHLPDGERYYAWMLRVATTTSMSAAEIHALGIEQSRDLESQMDTLLRAQGLTQGTPGERMAQLAKDARFTFPNTDQGRANAIAYSNELLAEFRRRMRNISRLELRASAQIQRVPTANEEGAALAYMSPGSLDGARPSVFYLNLRDTATWPKFALPTIVCHETVPGHVWQEAYGLEYQPWHMIRTLLRFNAYTEGWALYAEQLADEMGLYTNDPFARLGYLQAQQLRATRLVVDTGLHALRWTREQAVDRLAAATGRPRPAAVSEIDRYCVKPGQACGYKIGQLEILKMRKKESAALGQRFDLRSFNDGIVKAGNLPLTALNAAMQRTRS
jgi:uncharacterized protein (DUF885 family)